MIDDYLQTIMAQHHIPGLSVAAIQEGETVLIKGYGLANVEHAVSATEHTVYEIASIGKTFSAIATLMLVEEGMISLSDRIIDYLDDPPEAWQPVTLKHILTHQSGIPSYTDAPNYWELTRLELSKAEVLGLVSDLPLKFPPGQESAYDNTGYYLLGLMLEKVMGKTYGEVLRDRIFAPLGMNATQMNNPAHIVPHRASGYQWRNNQLHNKPYYSPSVTYSAGGQLSSVADMVKWEKALYNQTLLQPATLEQMWMPYPSVRGNEWEDRRYALGLGWFILNYGDRRVVGHNGSILGFASNITRFIDDRISVIVLCNLDRIARPDAIAKTIAGYYCPSLAELPLQPPQET
ncbi:beta-lactamase family protein [Desertifilum sp. FACHB-1129]|uniref:Serine hydrolase n=2 Tax=Desertifilum tharense IPPAS B-1220 TaxID=1781255 RepID=A0A1E5QCV1_9CYAN|nr:serine hydrolase domain-containing protein [Desertifilum tharense]MBD2313892.1 beta-lactamase family protein [Desertifilum sp. FACHB-1129]MBD2324723.1 beta-lactamase family protein [Desertifilum sp. FACHB-866]MBD2334883.1 beta-lactamase family protein [Desertifilum sp. FACHB-868]MDA0210471.1 serine hydrolase [Cyanobacteria bacterium FC1]OEJ72485.1 serine hydrolase [Desertifilum tharense IPPAS B-1220]